MKRLVKWSMVVFMLVSFAGCGSEQNEAIEAYKSEARYYYEQVDAILENLNVIEEMDNSMNNIEDGFFASTLNKAMFRSTCLENLISVSQYYYGLEVSMEQMIDLYNTIPQKEEIDNMKEIIDGLDSSCNDLKKVLEGATEYNSDFLDRYNSNVEDMVEQADALYGYVDSVESAAHNLQIDKEIVKGYTEELEDNEKNLTEETALGSQERPLCVGDSVEISFIDNGAGRKNDSWYVATGRFTYKGNEDGVVNLNFELLTQEAGTGITLGNKYGSGFSFMVANENLQQDFVSYEDGVYRSEDKNEYVAVLEGGNIDFSVKTGSDTSYLLIYYVEPTEENMNLSNLISATEKQLWFKVD